jgi:cytochrome c nitrite reductase small subunit
MAPCLISVRAREYPVRKSLILSRIVFQLGRPAIVIAALTGTLAGAFTFD